MLSVGNSIKTLRLQKRWTQKELSEKTGIRQGMISSYENDDYSPGIKHLNTLADVFKVSVSAIDERLSNIPELDKDLLKIIEYFSDEENEAEKHDLLAKIARKKGRVNPGLN